ncbi:MAG: hypothetical protein IKE33_05410 [Erysipelotrichaceae bacterium]|nr:hypothetical protein [Erysipelotrichaceae bacterium]
MFDVDPDYEYKNVDNIIDFLFALKRVKKLNYVFLDSKQGLFEKAIDCLIKGENVFVISFKGLKLKEIATIYRLAKTMHRRVIELRTVIDYSFLKILKNSIKELSLNLTFIRARISNVSVICIEDIVVSIMLMILNLFNDQIATIERAFESINVYVFCLKSGRIVLLVLERSLEWELTMEFNDLEKRVIYRENRKWKEIKKIEHQITETIAGVSDSRNYYLDLIIETMENNTVDSRLYLEILSKLEGSG